MGRRLQDNDEYYGDHALVYVLINMLNWCIIDNEELRTDNEILRNMTEKLQCTLDKQIAEFRTEVNELQQEQQLLKSAMNETQNKMVTLQSSIQQLVLTCDKLQEEKKLLKAQVRQQKRLLQESQITVTNGK